MSGPALILLALAPLLWFVLVVLFSPRIDYRITSRCRDDDGTLLRVLSALCQSRVHPGNRVAIMSSGAEFYPAMREAILAATASVHLEAYIFEPGQAADMLITAMVERAGAGVEVRLVLDAIGSSAMRGAPLARLQSAGCQVHFYQPLKWYRLHRLNNRTHRELLVVDGRVAMTGGAGVADWWLHGTDGAPPWRDTMARIEGPVATALQGVFAENWLECCGEILTDPSHWPPPDPAGTTAVMVVRSSPSDRATVSRVVFQMLIEHATASIAISTPYFLPDRALRRTLCQVAARGVRISVMVPGPRTDQRHVRYASRRLYGELLAAGVRIHEYQPGMTHVKSLVVDGDWAVIGTTNIDNRSFEHNDEVNVAFREPAVASRLTRDFEADLQRCQEVTYEMWRSRPWLEKVAGPVIWLLERQQ
jgi:cardiolipin synthase